MTSSIVVGLPIGSNCKIGFVFKDYLNAPIDLTGSEFIIMLKAPYPSVTLQFDTTSNPNNLYIEEDVLITPVGAPGYTADRLVLSVTPEITRQFPLGALSHWEIEQRQDGMQSNWGAGLFNGYGGMNPDV